MELASKAVSDVVRQGRYLMQQVRKRPSVSLSSRMMQEAKVATVSAEHDRGTTIGAAGRVVCFNAYTDQTRMWQASYLLMPGNTTID